MRVGVAQVVELSNQLRGICGARQVLNCKIAMQHNIGRFCLSEVACILSNYVTKSNSMMLKF